MADPLTESQLRFQLRLALGKLPRSVLRDLVGKPDAHDRGTAAAVEILHQHFARHQVIAPEGRALDFGEMEKR